jgi:hypothetical protein
MVRKEQGEWPRGGQCAENKIQYKSHPNLHLPSVSLPAYNHSRT